MPIMKPHQRLACIAFTALAVASMAATAQGVTVYGRMVLTINQLKTGSSTSKELRDSASRLGFRGVEDLGGGLQAQFGLEMGFNADTGSLLDPMYRNSYVALRGGWGAVALGRLDSANPTGSPLYSQIIELTSFAPNDAGATATSTAMQNARNRTSNSIGYISPTWADTSLRARYYLRGAGTAADPEDAASSIDLGLNHRAGALKLALGYAKDSRRGGLASNEFDDKWQVGLNYQLLPALDVYALGGVDRYKNTATRRRNVPYSVVGASYTVGQHKLVVNWMEREVQTSLTGERKRLQLSHQYFLSKRTDLQAFIDSDGVDSSRSNVRVRAVGVGIRHNF